MVITSRENKIFKNALALKTARGRSDSKMFIIEGVRSVQDALSKGAKLSCVIKKDGCSVDISCDCPVYTFAPKLFDNITETVTPQGVMAICHMLSGSVEDIVKTGKNCVVMCEALQDPGNIGTVIRTAHAASCAGVILTKGCCDLYNPKIVRATMTGIFSVPVVQNIEAETAIAFLKKNGYSVCAGALTESAVDFFDADLSGKHLIIIGNEGNGVTEKTISACDKVLKIPMQSDAESLNASVAGAVMIYEHFRQNRKK